MPQPPERNSEEWNRIWEGLRAGLEKTPLKREDGSEVYCTIDDFMLMNVDEDGSAHFKNIITRNYLVLNSDGSLTIPLGGMWAEGAFERNV